MLLKASNTDRAYQLSNGKGKSRSFNSRIHRKTFRTAVKPSTGKGKGKRVPGAGKRISVGKNYRTFNTSSSSYSSSSSSSLCDNSNDSGLGFENHESHHYSPTMQQQQQRQHQNQIVALNDNNSSYYHHTINTSSIRYGGGINNVNIGAEFIQASDGTITTDVALSPKKLSYLSDGKKIKHVISSKPFTLKVTPPPSTDLTLRAETEDTCGDDFFSTHIQRKNSEGQLTSLKSNSSVDSEKFSASPSSISSLSERSTPDTPTEDIVKLEDNFSLLDQNLTSASQKGDVQLQIVTQPEQQHRARYQTEGSRGAVKDKSGNGFPVVKLCGYSKPTTLQVFIGNDVGRVSPHIFYQACKVSGKNSTPCNETKIDGTMVIEIEMKPENDMTVICDCVGILKERNVDVEHRLGKNHTLAASVTRNKKKSTKCRMIFRAKIDDEEILQVCSNTITCTQPPGVPEICKKSLDSCSVLGGQELFIIGKNFLKDTKVSFVRFDEGCNRQPKKIWEESVLPDKEYLQQTHLICVVPPYPNAEEITEPLQIQIFVTSSNKKSEAHNFTYVPLKKYRSIPQSPTVSVDAVPTNVVFSPTNANETSSQLLSTLGAWSNEAQNADIMPPPASLVRKSSFSKNISTEPNESTAAAASSPTSVVSNLKCEFIDQTLNSNVNNIETVSTQSTSNPATTNIMQPSTKEISAIFKDSAMIDVTNSFAMVDQVQVQNCLLNDAVQLHHIKNEQNDQQISLMHPPPQPPSTTVVVPQTQQHQVVENFINMICAQVEVPSPITSTEINHHLNPELILNSPTNISASLPDHSVVTNPFSAITTTSSMLCEPNLMSVSSIPMSLESSVIPVSSDTSNASLMSNAVSESVAETQAVVQNIIANVAAEILQQENPTDGQSTMSNFISNTLENPTETQSTISNFISTTLEQQTQQISSSQQQQLQDIIAQEVVQELLTPVLVKKEENNTQESVQENILNVVAPPNNISAADPCFNLTQMTENDLINFINPTVFM